MPLRLGTDAAGVLYYTFVRGIERKQIIQDEGDMDHCLGPLEDISV